ncbi:ROK family transcriptional regulator [Nocardioides maradonensis]
MGVAVTELTADYLDSLTALLGHVRADGAITRSALAHRAGLGRAAVTQRVNHLIDLGLVEDGEMASSTGGRAAREVRFRAEVGRILVAEFGATSLSVAITDLSCGTLRHEREEALDIDAGPEVCLARAEALFDEVLAADGPGHGPVWGIGIGVPGPVEFATGLPISPPIMPGWDGYPIRERFQERYDAPVWVDNEVNLMALGELRAGLAVGQHQALFVKVGTGIGAGLISNGVLHRGEQGCAGDVGHIAAVHDEAVLCRCGNRGCLEAFAGGAALARLGGEAARDGRSTFLAGRLAANGEVTAVDVADGAHSGDPVSNALLVRAGNLIGETLATVVNFFNPSLILIGGGVADSGDLFLASIREAIYRRALPLATRDLRLGKAVLGKRSGTTGAAYMVSDQLFSRALLERWLPAGSPVGVADRLHG